MKQKNLLKNDFKNLFEQVSFKFLDGKIEVRGFDQRLMLYNLLDQDWDMYCELETAIIEMGIHYCPADRDECQYLISKYRCYLFCKNL